MDVPCIDLHAQSRELLEKLGEEPSKELFLWIKPGVYSSMPEGKQDDTHFSEFGAWRIAGLVTQSIVDSEMPLRKYIVSGKESHSLLGAERR